MGKNYAVSLFSTWQLLWVKNGFWIFIFPFQNFVILFLLTSVYQYHFTSNVISRDLHHLEKCSSIVLWTQPFYRKWLSFRISLTKQCQNSVFVAVILDWLLVLPYLSTSVDTFQPFSSLWITKFLNRDTSLTLHRFFKYFFPDRCWIFYLF